jgi:cell fate (sporulation/competence/biofilm development) regulator YmcA (YheA/YmcA/DUF963 family)
MVIILLITVDIKKELGKKIRELRREISHEELVHCYQSKVDAINGLLSYLWSCFVNYLATLY